uniref:Uncharacterized protein n=1 Tax=Rhizophora mucronata TaxID=61149 RepID=A0A2P2PG21_RHIMU
MTHFIPPNYFTGFIEINILLVICGNGEYPLNR